MTNLLPRIWEILQKQGIKQLNPVQEKALEAGLLDKKNIILAAPTASGKTLVAEIAFLNYFLASGGKCIYIVPLRALATEKFEEFQDKYRELGARILLETGELDSTKINIPSDFDLMVTTAEKCDSILRSKPWIFDNVKLVIIDEIHLLNDVERGPTLEVVATRLKNMNPQFLGLSATIGNPEEIAGWLNANLVKSTWRPVKLEQSVYLDGTLYLDGKEEEFLKKSGTDVPELDILHHLMSNKKQALIFLASRPSAEKCAENCGKIVEKFLNLGEKEDLRKVALEIEKAMSPSTKQCKRLALCVRMGSCFHHAGLVAKQRKLIENNFKNGLIRVISATPTLAAGVNLPAYMVIMRDLKRFSGRGMDWIPTLEYHQMAGRAGRPKFYDSEGKAVSIAKDEKMVEEIQKRFIFGKPENIFSKLGVEPVLRMHILSLVASGEAKTEEAMLEFFSGSFFSFQYGNSAEFRNRIFSVLGQLLEYGFIQKGDNRIEATPLGRRISELYIDPETAWNLINHIDKISDAGEIGIFQLISNTKEMKPLPSVSSGDIDEFEADFVGEKLIETPPNQWDYEYKDFLSSVKMAYILRDWVEEKRENWLMERYKITPGSIRTKIEETDWLLYALEEIAKILKEKEVYSKAEKLRLRVKDGIKEELLNLVKLRGIGRIRARKLFDAGITNIKMLKNTPREKLNRVLGEGISEKVLEERIDDE